MSEAEEKEASVPAAAAGTPATPVLYIPEGDGDYGFSKYAKYLKRKKNAIPMGKNIIPENDPNNKSVPVGQSQIPTGKDQIPYNGTNTINYDPEEEWIIHMILNDEL